MEIKRFMPTNHNIKALIYGWPWKWKTRFGGTAYWTMEDPKMIVASAEAWLLTYAQMGINPPYVQIKTLKDLQELYVYLRDEEHGYETVLIDSITEINDIIKSQKEKAIWKPLQIQHWGEISKAIEWILRDFRNLDMNVIFIAQEKEIIDDNKIAKVVPMLNWQTATKISYFMDIVWHAELSETGDYIINLHTSDKYDNKTRVDTLKWIVEPDFKKWQKAIAWLETCEVEDMIYKTLSKEEQEALKKEEQQKRFADHHEAIQSSKNMDDLQQFFGDFIKAWKQAWYVTQEHVNELVELKNSMKTAFEWRVERIADLKDKIQAEEDDYNNSMEHPTDTAQFRNACAKQKEKIDGWKKELLELDPPKKEEVKTVVKAKADTKK